MEQEEAAAFARQWVTAWNDRDVEAVLSHFADDAVFTSPLADRVMPGCGLRTEVTAPIVALCGWHYKVALI
jgi:uncharacterized protein (TIGR02246 family)